MIMHGGEILETPSRLVVHDDDLIPALKQLFGQMGTNKTGAAGH